MSLINHMLSDLQTRRGGVRLQDELVLEGLSAVEQRAPEHRSWTSMVAIVALAALLGILAYRVAFEHSAGEPLSGLGKPSGVSSQAMQVATAERSLTTPEVAAPQAVSMAGEKDSEIDAVPERLSDSAAEIALTSDAVAAADEPEAEQSQSTLSDPSLAGIEPATALRSAEPEPVAQISDEPLVSTRAEGAESAVPAASMAAFDAKLVVVAATPDEVEPAATEILFVPPAPASSGDPKAVETPNIEAGIDFDSVADLQQELALQPVIEETGNFTKTARRNALDVGAKELYDNALALMRNGERNRAMEALFSLLDIEPLHVDGRLAVIGLLREADQIAESIALLAEGAALRPGETRFTVPYARILVDQNDLEGALRILERRPPGVAEDADYHAFLAAIYQRMERHDEAIPVYRAILEIDPAKGVWWMGLGISLTAIEQHYDALEAFNRSLADSSLSSGLRRYVAQRIEALRRLQT